MNELIRDKLRRLKGLPTKKISTKGVVILNDEQAEAAFQFELLSWSNSNAKLMK